MIGEIEPAAVGGSMAFVRAVWRDSNNGDHVNDFDDDNQVGIHNDGVPRTVTIAGSYFPFGPDKIWIIKIVVKNVVYTAVLNGEGGWLIDVPANTFTADTIEKITVDQCVMNGRLALHPIEADITIGQSE